MHSIIYSLYMRLRLCIILVIFRTGLKVNVMRITLQDNKCNIENMFMYCKSKHFMNIFAKQECPSVKGTPWKLLMLQIRNRLAFFFSDFT